MIPTKTIRRKMEDQDNSRWTKIATDGKGDIWIDENHRIWYSPHIKHGIQKKRQKEPPMIELTVLDN